MHPVVNTPKQVGWLVVHQLYLPSNFQANSGDKLSCRKMCIEVPWGAVLVMVLFNMFINDLEERLDSTFIKLAYALEKY